MFTSFKIWLEAFQEIKPDMKSSGYGISSMPFRDRVSRGRGVEEKIKNMLRNLGHDIRDPLSFKEDVYDKIDAYWDGDPIQIKYRDTGDDVLFELIKPYNSSMPLKDQHKGKDYRSKAKFYVVLSRDEGTIYKIPKSNIMILMNQAMNEIGNRPMNGRYYDARNGVKLIATKDRYEGTPKVNAFIPTNLIIGISKIYPVAA